MTSFFSLTHLTVFHAKACTIKRPPSFLLLSNNFIKWKCHVHQSISVWVFWVLTTRPITALDIHVQVLMWMYFKSSEYVPKNGTTRSYGNLLIILKNYEAFSKFTAKFLSVILFLNIFIVTISFSCTVCSDTGLAFLHRCISFSGSCGFLLAVTPFLLPASFFDLTAGT